jgi:2,4-dienoyl-CoA reductase-like NADH-dependent reductase (Old Yellow Enzyme family)
MVTLNADRGYISEQQLAYYAARARGGVGLIVTEALLTSVCLEIHERSNRFPSKFISGTP